MYAIQEIKEVAPFYVTVRFDTGFASVKLNPEIETIYWDNGIDFCPDMLYAMGKKSDRF